MRDLFCVSLKASLYPCERALSHQLFICLRAMILFPVVDTSLSLSLCVSLSLRQSKFVTGAGVRFQEGPEALHVRRMSCQCGGLPEYVWGYFDGEPMISLQASQPISNHLRRVQRTEVTLPARNMDLQNLTKLEANESSLCLGRKS